MSSIGRNDESWRPAGQPAQGKPRDLQGQAQGGQGGSPQPQVFGEEAIRKALEGIEFPASKDQILQRAGPQNIQYRRLEPVILRDVVDGLPQDGFQSMDEVVRLVAQAIERRAPGGVGVKGQQPQQPPRPGRTPGKPGGTKI